MRDLRFAISIIATGTKKLGFGVRNFLMITPAKDDYHMTKKLHPGHQRTLFARECQSEFDAGKADEAATL
jgi:hypothetical protein